MPSDAAHNNSTVTLTTFHRWDGWNWVEVPAPPVTGTGEGWVPVPHCVKCGANIEAEGYVNADGPQCPRCYQWANRPIYTQPNDGRNTVVAALNQRVEQDKIWAANQYRPSPVFPTVEDALRSEIAVLRGTLAAVRDVVPPGWRAQIDEVLG